MDPIQRASSTVNNVFFNVSVQQMSEYVEGSGIVLGSHGDGNESNKLKAGWEQEIAELNKVIQAIQGPQRTLEFSIHKETHAVMIKVMNKETGELIREIPPEKLLDIAAKMMELAGLIVDKKI